MVNLSEAEILERLSAQRVEQARLGLGDVERAAGNLLQERAELGGVHRCGGLISSVGFVDLREPDSNNNDLLQ
jgi:hypothetical protein